MTGGELVYSFHSDLRRVYGYHVMSELLLVIHVAAKVKLVSTNQKH